MRVLPRSSPVPPIDRVIAENQAIYSKFELSYPRPGTDDEFADGDPLPLRGDMEDAHQEAEQAGNHELAQLAAEMPATSARRLSG